MNTLSEHMQQEIFREYFSSYVSNELQTRMPPRNICYTLHDIVDFYKNGGKVLILLGHVPNNHSDYQIEGGTGKTYSWLEARRILEEDGYKPIPTSMNISSKYLDNFSKYLIQSAKTGVGPQIIIEANEYSKWMDEYSILYFSPLKNLGHTKTSL